MPKKSNVTDELIAIHFLLGKSVTEQLIKL